MYELSYYSRGKIVRIRIKEHELELYKKDIGNNFISARKLEQVIKC